MYRFVNFKGFADATLELRTPVTILIGRNGSGKSNAIEGIRVLGALLSRFSMSDISNSQGPNRTEMLRGQFEGAVRRDKTSFSVEYTARTETKLGDVTYSVEYAHQPGGTPGSRAKRELLECLKSDGRVLMQTGRGTDAGHALAAVYENSGDAFPTAMKSQGRVGTDTIFLPNLDGAGYRDSVPLVHEAATTILAQARKVAYLAPRPPMMRGAANMDEWDISEDMHNLAAILEVLKSGTTEQRAILGRVVELISSVPEEPVVEIQTFPVGQLKKVLFGLMGPAGLISAELMSDGTLHALAIATALEICWEGSIVIIEDFDAGVHPARVKALLDFAWTVAVARKLRVVVTTHNSALLDALNLDQMKGVVLCWWDAAEKASKLKHLIDLPDPWPILEPGHLGDAATTEQYRSRLNPKYAEGRRAAMKLRMDQTQANLKAAEVPK